MLYVSHASTLNGHKSIVQLQLGLEHKLKYNHDVNGSMAIGP